MILDSRNQLKNLAIPILPSTFACAITFSFLTFELDAPTLHMLIVALKHSILPSWLKMCNF